MERQLLDRITPVDRAAVSEACRLLKEAHQVWNRIESAASSTN